MASIREKITAIGNYRKDRASVSVALENVQGLPNAWFAADAVARVLYEQGIEAEVVERRAKLALKMYDEHEQALRLAYPAHLVREFESVEEY